MGSCYSRKASGGKHMYSAVKMASPKLDESSRHMRPTPYSRNVPTSPTGLAFKKCIPPPTVYRHSSGNANELPDIRNRKSANTSPLQSSIPKFSSVSHPVIDDVSDVNKNSMNYNKQDVNVVHVLNNNANVCNSSKVNVNENVPALVSKRVKDTNATPSDDLNNKTSSCNMTSQKKAEDKVSKIPSKLAHATSSPRPSLPQFSGKSLHAVSHINAENKNISRSQLSNRSISPVKEKQNNVKEVIKNPNSNVNANKLSPVLRVDNGSTEDMDSGLGNSITDKSKQDDSDTLKDVEHLESCDDFVISPSDVVKKTADIDSISNEKNVRDSKFGLKHSMYKRELNGKWTFDNNCLQADSESKFSKNQVPNFVGKNSYKSSPDNSLPTYAYYKGLMSYKKQYYSKADNAISSNHKEKSLQEKNSKNASHEVSNIPKVTSLDREACVKSEKIKDVTCGDPQKVDQSPNALHKTESHLEKLSNSSSELEEKSDSIGSGVKSPVSDIENRDFLIDDEISDQPDLILCENGKSVETELPSLRQSVTELHALQVTSSKSSADRKHSLSSSRYARERTSTSHRDSLILGSDLGSSCSSIASDDLMLDYEKSADGFPEGTVNEGLASPVRKLSNLEVVTDHMSSLQINADDKNVTELEDKLRKHLYRRSSGQLIGAGSSNAGTDWRLRSVSVPLRPPRPMSISEDDDGSLKLDASSYRLICQDLNGVKTLLLRLKTVIQEAETINPFDPLNTKNIFYHNLVHTDFPVGSSLLLNDEEKNGTDVSLTQENADLRRQLVLLQQQLEDKDHAIHLLQQQMTKYTSASNAMDGSLSFVNAATQTERAKVYSSSLSSSLSSSADDSSETLVSFRISKCTGRL